MMKRRNFIRNLFGLYGLSLFPLELVKQYQKVYLLQFFVRGFQYYHGPKIIHLINKYKLAELHREPDNKYDPDAIAVYFDEFKIGYVPREHNLILAKILDAGLIDIQAEIRHIEPKAQTWEQVNMAIYALKEDNGKKVPEHLSKTQKPSYQTLSRGEDKYVRIRYEDKPMIDGTQFYKNMAENSKNNSVLDSLHESLEQPDDLDTMIEQSRFVINRHKKPELNPNEFFETIQGQVLHIDQTFSEDGYVVASAEKISQFPDKIEKFVNIISKSGERFIEIILK